MQSNHDVNDVEDSQLPISKPLRAATLDSNEAQGGGSCPWRDRRRRPLLPLLLVLAVAGLMLLPHAARAVCFQGRASPQTPPAAAVIRPGGQARGLLSRTRDSAVQRLQAAVVQVRQFNPFPPAARRRVVECFQVAQPVLKPRRSGAGSGREPAAAESCTVVLMDHVFAWSYGQPFVGKYSPPACDFNRVVMNFTVVSAGRQFDRLAIMYLNDTEVWRTSTAEPVAAPGIRWEYNKDMTSYLSFWKTPQTVIFDLGNLVDNTYNGTFNTTLTASFFKADPPTAAAPPADLIIPITGRNGSQAVNPVSVFVLPQQRAQVVVSAFPRNANRAVISVSACGQADEEFWWSNLLESDVAVFNATVGMGYGLSPFREVQALIDGRLAGVTWPFPVIFTGGVVPSLHRPVVGLQAFDLREHEIDITPWLPLLCDGNPHTVSFRISGLNDDGEGRARLSDTINMNWPITGKIFVWLDDSGSITTGSAPEVRGLDPTIKISHRLFQDQQGSNQSLTYAVEVQRDFTVTSTVVTQRSTKISTWEQTLSYLTKSNVTSYGEDQVVDFSVTGSDTATVNQAATYGHDYCYPLTVDMQTVTESSGALSLRATMNQGIVLQVSGAAVYPDGLEAFNNTAHGVYAASVLSTSRRGLATFRQSADRRSTSGTGQTLQEFSFGGNFLRYPDTSAATGVGPQPDVMLYFRNVSTDGNAVVRDRETVADGVVSASANVGRDVEAETEAAASDEPPFGAAGEQVIMTPHSHAAAVPRSNDDANSDDDSLRSSQDFAFRIAPFMGRGPRRVVA